MPYNVEVKITNPDGQIAIVSAPFTFFAPAPVVNTMLPTSGPQSGGTLVQLTGSGFQAGAVVTFGGQAGSNVQVAPDGLTLTVVTPAYVP